MHASYVPPEVLAFHAEARHATARCSYGCPLDVWSFGATLWEVVAPDKLVPKAFVESAEREAAALRQRLGRPPPAVTAAKPEALALHGRAGLVEISPLSLAELSNNNTKTTRAQQQTSNSNSNSSTFRSHFGSSAPTSPID